MVLRRVSALTRTTRRKASGGGTKEDVNRQSPDVKPLCAA
jgi:hypothetical protein